MHGTLPIVSTGPVPIKSNEFWGRRGGKVHRDGSLAFQQTQYGSGRENIGPHVGKRRRRFYNERVGDGIFVAGIARRHLAGNPHKKFSKSHSNAKTDYSNLKLKRKGVL